jgi:heme A synthase
MVSAFRWLTSVLFVAIVVQVGLAGYGAFDAVHKADKASVSKKAIEDGFNSHAALGAVILVVMLALLLLALVGHLGKENVRMTGGIVLLGVLQYILGVASTSAPLLGVLHTVNALALYAASALLAHRAWTKGRPRASGASASTPVP